MRYHQITSEERYTISALRMQGYSASNIALYLDRHRSTIGRELKRNQCHDGAYRPVDADSMTRRRRRESRKRWYFSDAEWQMVVALLRLDWSPEQISGWLKINNILNDVKTSRFFSLLIKVGKYVRLNRVYLKIKTTVFR